MSILDSLLESKLLTGIGTHDLSTGGEKPVDTLMTNPAVGAEPDNEMLEEHVTLVQSLLEDNRSKAMAIGLFGKSDEAHSELLEMISKIKTKEDKTKAIKMLRDLELGAERTWMNPSRFTWALKPAFILWYPLASVIRHIKADSIEDYKAELRKVRTKVEAVKMKD